jgi:hypothetical protein
MKSEQLHPKSSLKIKINSNNSEKVKEALLLTLTTLNLFKVCQQCIKKMGINNMTVPLTNIKMMTEY